MSHPSPAAVLLQPPRPTTAFTASASNSPQHTLSPPTPTPTPPLNFAPLELFTKHASLPGTVLIRVEDTVFRCHRDVLWLGSPFFEAALGGGWSETEPKPTRREPSGRQEAGVASWDQGDGKDTPRVGQSPEQVPTSPPAEPDSTDDDEDWKSTRPVSVAYSEPAPSMTASYLSSVLYDDDSEAGWEDDDDGRVAVVARLWLRDEKAQSFQDLLCHIYPRQECLISWNNVGELITMANKFDIPSLRQACITFLLPSAAGRPTLGLRIAEENNIPELYKEASRYVLDNYSAWPAEDLALLTENTLLKLERKRSWFLERLLKLGLVQISRDYVCHPACHDPSACAKLADDKWRSAWTSAFRNGTPQPSIIYRALRSVEPSVSSPALCLERTNCSAHARLFFADLFDRMFGLAIQPARSWSTALALHIPRDPGGVSKTSTSARYFLCVEMEGHEAGAAKKRSTYGHV